MNKKEKAIIFCESGPQYRQYNVRFGVAEKSFNRGQGSLSLYRFGDSSTIVANTLLETKADRKKLLRLFPECTVIESELGYPEYYTKGLPNPDTIIIK